MSKQTFNSILNTVKDSIVENNSTVLNRTITALVEVELHKRAELVNKSLNEFHRLSSMVSKIRPTSNGFTVDNEPLPETYTKEQMKEKKNLESLIKELDTAIGTAFAEANYKPLQDAVNKSNNLKSKNESVE